MPTGASTRRRPLPNYGIMAAAMQLVNRTALVTGSSRGIGRAIALALARAGADVAVNYVRDSQAAEEAVREIRAHGRRALSIQADVADAAQAQRLVAEAIGALGHLDILVNNAGIIVRRPFLELTLEEWDRVLATNLRGAFVVSQHAARHMAERRYGRIINISSLQGSVATIHRAAYCASKGGLNMLTKAMALDLAPYGITVNAIAAGITATDMSKARFSDPQQRELFGRWIPAGRIATPEDLTGAVVFLASDAAAYITGHVLAVDGGVLAKSALPYFDD